jgi:hypothetical protein
MVGALAVCPVCRLVQPPSARCDSCAAAAPVRFGDAPDRFLARKLRRPTLGRLRFDELPVAQQVVISLALASLIVFWPLFLPVACFHLTGSQAAGLWMLAAALFAPWIWVGTQPCLQFVDRGSSDRLAGVAPPRLLPPAGHELRGRARALGAATSAHGDRRPCLAARLVVSDGRQILLQSVRAVDFELVLATGEAVRVCGTLLVEQSPTAAPVGRAGLAEVLRHCDIPPHIQINPTARETCIRDGDELVAWGVPRAEPVTGGYRDAGCVPALRGSPGAPVHVRVRKAGRSEPARG